MDDLNTATADRYRAFADWSSHDRPADGSEPLAHCLKAVVELLIQIIDRPAALNGCYLHRSLARRIPS